LPVDTDHTFEKKEVEDIILSSIKCAVCLSKVMEDKYVNCTECNLNTHIKCAKLVKTECKKKAVLPFIKNEQAGRPTQIMRQSRVSRVSQKFQKTGDSYWSGYITYYTAQYQQFVTHYWKLSSLSIAVFIKDLNKNEKKLKDIPLISIVKVAQSGINADEFRAPVRFLFVLKTDEEIYFCGDGNQSENSPMNSLAKQFYDIFKMVYLPYENKCKL